MAAIDMALWDLRGKVKGVPVCDLLGGAIKSKIPVYASATAFDLAAWENQGILKHKSQDMLVKEAIAHVNLGFRAMKWGWGNYFSEENLETLFAIREAVGPKTKIMLDFGGRPKQGWKLHDAIQLTQSLNDHDIFFLEELLPPTDVNGFHTLTEHSPIKVATGEHLSTVYDCKQFIDRHAIDILQHDVKIWVLHSLFRYLKWLIKPTSCVYLTGHGAHCV